MRKFYLLILLFLLCCGHVQASHIMGGEITWTCLGNGQYRFRMKIYRDCNGVALNPPYNLRVHNHPTVQSIPMTLLSTTDISPQCDGSGPSITCAMGSGTNPIPGAVQEFIFESNPVNLPGIPPPQGWIFTWDNCCRNNAIQNLISAGTYGITLRSVMYPYNGQNTNPCFDSSPTFTERPATIICGGTPFTYNHNAFDPDLDSIAYSFAQPLDWLNGSAFSGGNPVPVPWDPSYSVNSPTPSATLNPQNVSSTLNTSTGEIAFQSFTFGNFVTVVRVQSYRCGVLVSEIFREIQIVILNCGANNPPVVTAPFVNPVTGTMSFYSDTVDAGDMVNFTINATDPEFLPTGFPQTISMTASGGQFGAGFSDTSNGCPYPPCATLNPVPPASAQGQTSVNFSWRTDCNHISYDEGCYSTKNLHTFILTFKDNYCPAPSYRAITVTIVVKAKPVMPPPSLRCTEVLPNGDVQLTWVPPPDTSNTFNAWMIYHSASAAGPYTLIDSVFNPLQNTYLHTGAGANLASQFYYVRTRSGCGGKVQTQPSDTLETIYVQASASGSLITVNWNAPSTPLLPTVSGPYSATYSNSPGIFQTLYTGTNTQCPDYFPGCTLLREYRVSIPDQSGCITRSNIYNGQFTNQTAPAGVTPDSVSVQWNGSSPILGWQAGTDTDIQGYIVYSVQNGVYTALDTVSSTNYTDMTVSADNGSLSYALSVIDSCGNQSDTSVIHTTIYLQNSLNACLALNQLSWSPYTAWPEGVQEYRIWVNENGGTYTLLATTSVLQYLHSGLQASSIYCYRIQAISNAGNSSTSNEICVRADVQSTPDYLYLRFATVVGDESIYLRCAYDTLADVKVIRLLRAPAGSSMFDTIGVMLPDWGTNEMYYTDNQVDVHTQSYDYKALLINNCYDIADSSNLARSILLQGESGVGLINRLRWNAYTDWPTGVSGYHLYRFSSVDTLPVQIYQGQMNGDMYKDDVAEVLSVDLLYCYRVIAHESAGNPLGYQDTSVSNTLCLSQEPTLFVPSAFRPEGNYNPVFKPFGYFGELLEEYELSVFNRWGEKLFETTDFSEGWDGKFRSDMSQQGIYVYRIRYRFKYKDTEILTGRLSLIR